jgi:hypothetical protein
VIHLATAIILILTTTLGMAFGIATGYLIIAGVLSVFSKKPEMEKGALAHATQGVAGD